MATVVFRILLDTTLIIHLSFAVFAALGGLLVIWRRRMAWVHIPAVIWAVLIELCGWVCPLTPLENWLRSTMKAPGGFVEPYILPVLYPDGLTRNVQLILGALVFGINAWIYGKWVFRDSGTHRRRA